jgi:hypothetical protein
MYVYKQVIVRATALKKSATHPENSAGTNNANGAKAMDPAIALATPT